MAECRKLVCARLQKKCFVERLPYPVAKGGYSSAWVGLAATTNPALSVPLPAILGSLCQNNRNDQAAGSKHGVLCGERVVPAYPGVVAAQQ